MRPGARLYLDGNYEKSIKYFDSMILVSPNYGPSYYNRGLSKGALFEFDAALADFDKCLSLSPNHHATHHAKGMLYASKLNPKAAIQSIGKAIEIDPQPQYRINRAKLLLQENEFHYAHDDLEKVLKASKSDDLEVLNMATRAAFKSGQFSKAKIWLDRCIRIQPSNKLYHFQRGTTFLKLTNYPLAVKDFNFAISLDKDYEEAYFYRAACRSYMNQAQGAISDYDEVVRINPKSQHAFYQRGYLHATNGNPTQGCKDLSIAHSLGLKAAMDLMDVYCGKEGQN